MYNSANSIGKCPNCGGDIMWGKYGPYCSEKCGMSLKKAFGKELTQDEVSNLLGGRKIFLRDLRSKSGSYYDAYLIPDGVKEFSYTNRNGALVSGYQFNFKMEFPQKEEEEYVF